MEERAERSSTESIASRKIIHIDMDAFYAAVSSHATLISAQPGSTGAIHADRGEQSASRI
jgi:hypothetical protein